MSEDLPDLRTAWTVLRDGRRIPTRPVSQDLAGGTVVAEMIGDGSRRRPTRLMKARRSRCATMSRGLTHPGTFENVLVSSVRFGEIPSGLAGLMGSRRSENKCAHIAEPDAGSERNRLPARQKGAVRFGCAAPCRPVIAPFVPEERKTEGLFSGSGAPERQYRSPRRP